MDKKEDILDGDTADLNEIVNTTYCNYCSCECHRTVTGELLMGDACTGECGEVPLDDCDGELNFS